MSRRFRECEKGHMMLSGPFFVSLLGACWETAAVVQQVAAQTVVTSDPTRPPPVPLSVCFTKTKQLVLSLEVKPPVKMNAVLTKLVQLILTGAESSSARRGRRLPVRKCGTYSLYLCTLIMKMFSDSAVRS